MTATAAARGWRRLLPAGPVGLAVAFNLVVLRSELTAAQTPNDLGMHMSMVRWASDRIGDGQLPLDGWYPYLGLGSPQFSQYPTLAHVLTGLAARVVEASAAVRWSEYVLLVAWPIAVYLGARLLGLDRWASSGAAVVAPLLTSRTSYGLELSSYVWRGFGIWPQVWAQALLPIALGLSWRAINRRAPMWPAAIAVGLTFALHFVTGYVCVLGVGALALGAVASTRAWRDAAARAGRATLVVAGGLAAIAYVLVPLLQQRRWASFPGLDRQTVDDDAAGFGPEDAVSWLATGEIYDHGRLPVITALVILGLVVCGVRREPVHRAVLALWTTTFFVFAFGSSLGVLDALLPGSSDLFTRFVIGVHLSGILAAGVGAAASAVTLHAAITRAGGTVAVAAGAVAVAAGVALAPAWRDVQQYQRESRSLIAHQREQDARDGADLEMLLERIPLSRGRVYAGAATTWGPSYAIGDVPVYIWLNNHDVDAIGYGYRVGSLSSEVEVNFIDVLPGSYPLFGVRYLLTPADRVPPPGLEVRKLASAGRHALWEVMTTSGYLGVVDTEGTITAEGRTLGTRSLPFLAAVPPEPHRHPTLALGDAPAAPATDPSGIGRGSPGEIVAEAASPADGRFAATVTARRAAAVILRTSYSGKWSVRVDGQDAVAYPVAPSFVATTVAAGRHDVVFTYQPYGSYPALWAAGVAAILALVGFDRGWFRRLRSRHRRPPG